MKYAILHLPSSANNPDTLAAFAFASGLVAGIQIDQNAGYVRDQLDFNIHANGAQFFAICQGGGYLAVAELHTKVRPALAAHVPQPAGELWKLATRADYRRQGMGSLLLRHVEQIASKQGLRSVCVQPTPGNPGNPGKPTQFFANRGYRPYPYATQFSTYRYKQLDI